MLETKIKVNESGIPPTLKNFRRWLCWRLEPAGENKKPKKIPMTVENGELVAADATNSAHWLTFPEALSWYKKKLCSGIGFALSSDTPPQICCVDVDNCVDADGNLSELAKDIIAICGCSYVEVSQSGKGVHIFFIDAQFLQSRKKGDVEVYGESRYIAVTGAAIEFYSDELLKVDGACNAVIEKYCGGLTDTSGEILNHSFSLLPTADAQKLLDADEKLKSAFQKLYNTDDKFKKLWTGDISDYASNSEADAALMQKLCWLTNGKAQQMANLFSLSELSKRDKAGRADYISRTINFVLNKWTGDHYEHRDEINDEKHLDADEKNFESEKQAALEFVRDTSTFEPATVFSEKFVASMAFAKLYDRQLYSATYAAIQNFRAENKHSFSLTDFKALIKSAADDLTRRADDLTRRRNIFNAQKKSCAFLRNENLSFNIPPNYEVTADGISKHVGDEGVLVKICRQPVIISQKFLDTVQKTVRYMLAYKTPTSQQWKLLPAPVEGNVIFNNRRLVDLASAEVPVTSSNASALVDFLDAFLAENEKNIPVTYTINRVGWYEKPNGEIDYIEPRRKCTLEVDGVERELLVDNQNTVAQYLRQKGSIDEWKRGYDKVKIFPIVRFLIAAAVATPLLYVLNERNFFVYVYTVTTAGKTSAFRVAASAVGDTNELIRSFDGTLNGLTGIAATANDVGLILDEKESADARLRESLAQFIHGICDGVERQRADRNGNAKQTKRWRVIGICNGETQLLADNSKGGEYTRVLQLAAPNPILPPDICRDVRDIFCDNYGWIFPAVIDEILEVGFDALRALYKIAQKRFSEHYPEILDDYRRYIALVTVDDLILNKILSVDEEVAAADALKNAFEIFKLVPTRAEISDASRELDFVRDFVTVHQKYFEGFRDFDATKVPKIFGKFDAEFVYIVGSVLKDECKRCGFDYKKLVADLIASGAIIPADKVETNHRKPLSTVQTKINGCNSRCYRFVNDLYTDFYSGNTN